MFDGELKKLKTNSKTKIGNDVWIGHNVIILSGITIGDGAILAAGSIITKDVEPYTIVAGNPAKTIRKRFSENVIIELLDFKWWDLSNEQIDKNKKLFLTDLTKVESIKNIIIQ